MILAVGASLAAGAIAYGVYKYRDENIDKIIKKGTLLQNVSVDEHKGVADAFYFSKNKLDNTKYRGIYGETLKKIHGKDVYATKMKAIADLKVASEKSATNVLKEIAGSDGSFKKDLEYLIRDTESNLFGPQKAVMTKGLNKLRSGIIDKDVYTAMNMSLANHMTPQGDSVRETFYKIMAEKGYDVIGDLNDKKYSGYSTFSPMIAFNGKDKISVESVQKLADTKIGQDKTVGMLAILGQNSVKEVSIYAAAISGALALEKKYRVSQLNKQVETYRKEHPESKLSYDEIAKMLYEKKKV